MVCVLFWISLIAHLSEGSLVDRVGGWHMMTFLVTEDVTIFWIPVSQSDGSLVDNGQIFLWFWSDFGLIFGQNWSDSQSDFYRFFVRFPDSPHCKINLTSCYEVA